MVRSTSRKGTGASNCTQELGKSIFLHSFAYQKGKKLPESGKTGKLQKKVIWGNFVIKSPSICN